MKSRARWGFALCALVGGLTLVAHATTVVAPTFAELVSEAQTVFVGETIDVQSRWVTTPSGPLIVTRVVFNVEQTLKGSLGLQTVLEFTGGTVGEYRLEVSDMPKFRVGDRDVLFVDERQHPVSPLVGFMHGRFRLMKDPATGQEVVSRWDYRPVTGVTEIGAAPAQARVALSRAMTLRAFADQVTAAVRRLPAQK